MADRKESGVSIVLDAQVSEFTKQIRDAEKSVNELQKEFRLLDKASKLDPDNIRAYSKSLSTLETIYNTQSGLLYTYTDKLRVLKELHGEDSTQVAKTTTAYNKLAASLEVTQGQLKQLSPSWREVASHATDFNKNIEDTKTRISGLQEEFKLLDKASKLDPSNVQTYTKAISVLRDTSKEYSSLMDQYSKRIDELTKSYGKGSIEVEKATAEYNKAAAAIDVINGQIKDYEGNVKTASDACNAWTVALGNLIAHGIRLATRELKKLSTEVVETGRAFEDGMTGLAAIYGVSNYSSDIQELSGYFRELALNSAYSATEIATNAQVLANAGYTISQTEDAILSIQDLATGTGESFETMANVVVDGLHAFGLSAEESTHFANVLAKAAVSSNTNVSLMGEAFKYAGSIAGTYGYQIEDVAQALGVMASNGIKGSQAGTTLRTVISRLAANTSNARDAIEDLGVQFYNADGSARPLMDVLNELRVAMSGMTDVEKSEIMYVISGMRGLTGFSAIINTQQDAWDNLTDAIANSQGAVARMASTRMDSLTGDVKKMKNAWTELSVSMYEDLEPSLRKTTKDFTNLINSADGKKLGAVFTRNATAAIETFDKTVLAVAPHMDVLLGTIEGVGAAFLTFKGLKILAENANTAKTALQLLTGGATTLTAAINPVTLGITGAAVAIGLLVAASEAGKNAWASEHETLLELINDNTTLRSSIDGVREAKETAFETATAEYNNTRMLIEQLELYVDENGKVKEGYEDRVNYILSDLSTATGTEISMTNGVIDSYKELVEQLKLTSAEQARQAYMAATTDAMAESYKNVATASTNVKTSADELSKAYAEQIVAIQNNDDAMIRSQLLDGQIYDKRTETYINYKELVKSGAEEIANFLAANEQLQSQTVTDAAQAYADANQLYTDSVAAYGETLNAMEVLRQEDANKAIADYVGLQSGLYDANSSTYEKMKIVVQEYEAARALAATTTDADLKAGLTALINDYRTQLTAWSEDPTNDITVQFDEEGGIISATGAVSSASQAAADQRAIDEETARAQATIDATDLASTYAESEIAETNAKAPLVAEANKTSADGANKAFKSIINKETGSTIAGHYADGIIEGLYAKMSEVQAAASALGRVIDNSVRMVNSINSPSKLAKETAGFYAQGLINGLEDKSDAVASAASSLGSVINSALETGAYSIAGLSAIGGAGSTTINQNYTFGNSYQPRDGLAAARDLDRMLGEASI